jgi:hypothetical protein
MYLPQAAARGACEVPSPDLIAGLHVRSRCGATVKVTPRRDQLLFQAGLCLQVHPARLRRVLA